MPPVTRHPLASLPELRGRVPVDAGFVRRTGATLLRLADRDPELGAAFLQALGRAGWAPDPSAALRSAGIGRLLRAFLARAVATDRRAPPERTVAQLARALERWFDARGPLRSVLAAAVDAVHSAAPEADPEARGDWAWTLEVVAGRLDEARALSRAGPDARRATRAPRATPPRSCSWRGPPPPPPRPR